MLTPAQNLVNCLLETDDVSPEDEFDMFVNHGGLVQGEKAIPSRYWKAKSQLQGLAKRKSGASVISQVVIVPGFVAPRITSGRPGGHFTKGGTPISHPGAYSKVGWSNMEYRTNDEVVEVGADWLFKRLPQAFTVYMQYRDADKRPQRASMSGQDWLVQQSQKADWAYNADDPRLGEAYKYKC